MVVFPAHSWQLHCCVFLGNKTKNNMIIIMQLFIQDCLFSIQSAVFNKGPVINIRRFFHAMKLTLARVQTLVSNPSSLRIECNFVVKYKNFAQLSKRMNGFLGLLLQLTLLLLFVKLAVSLRFILQIK